MIKTKLLSFIFLIFIVLCVGTYLWWYKFQLEEVHTGSTVKGKTLVINDRKVLYSFLDETGFWKSKIGVPKGNNTLDIKWHEPKSLTIELSDKHQYFYPLTGGEKYVNSSIGVERDILGRVKLKIWLEDYMYNRGDLELSYRILSGIQYIRHWGQDNVQEEQTIREWLSIKQAKIFTIQ